MTSAAARAVGVKQRRWISYRAGNASHEEYKVAEKKAKKELRKARRNFERGLSKQMKTNPRKFYSYVNSKNKRPRVGPLTDNSGSILTSDLEMAEEFNRCYANAFGRNGNIRTSPPAQFHTHELLTTIEFLPETVAEKLLGLKPFAAPGPDGIHPRILRECANELATPLSIIFNKSMEEGILPDEFKSTNITPIFKKGRKNIAANYRPINLASVPGKIMEQVIKDRIMAHLHENNIIFDSQHGFMPRRSCTTNLIDYLNVVTKTLDDGASFDAVLVDFQKAFDKVPFDGMLAKSKAHGIAGKLLEWLRNWTEDRHQRVVLNGVSSSWANVLSSVVQGSVLGPILFLMYINDIDIDILSADSDIYISKFADDTKLGRIINDINDSAKLQKGLNNLVKWCRDWGMSLHPEKCIVMHFGPKNPQFDYYIDGQKIRSEEVARDLGVHVSVTGDSTAHVEKIAKKAHGVLSQVRRATIVRDRSTVMAMYRSFVRPLLEFAAPAWSPHKRGDVEALEKVQKRCLRMISNLGGMTYEQKLTELNLQTLEDRRLRGDAIEAFKYINGFNDVDPNRIFSFVRDRHDRDTRSFEDNNLVPEKTRLDIRKFFFANRVTWTWNDLPNLTKEAASVNSFKNMYDELIPNLTNLPSTS